MYVLEGTLIINRQVGLADRVVAEVPLLSVDLEQVGLLISKANLSDRDEELFDQIGKTISSRNLV